MTVNTLDLRSKLAQRLDAAASSEQEVALAEPSPSNAAILDASSSPQEMAERLADMKTKLSLVQSFFKEVMVKDQDYGVIPGTEKPTLLKPGAEKLAEFYGLSGIVRDRQEETDKETGYYRAVVTVALINRRTGAVVAEGVGEANTLEARYRWRWVPEWKLPQDIDRSALHVETKVGRNGKPYRMYRVKNDDPFSLWNTVLKMAKKRAFVDAVLSATRSSGLFTQDLEDLQDWADAGQTIDAYSDGAGSYAPPEPDRVKEHWAAIESRAKKAGIDRKQLLASLNAVLAEYKANGLNDLPQDGWQEIEQIVARWESSRAPGQPVKTAKSNGKTDSDAEFAPDELPFKQQ